MRIAISAESTIDLPVELLDKYNIHTLPFTVTLGDKTALDGVITSEEIITYVNEHKILPKTSAVNTYQYEEHFKKLLETYDAVIHISLSSEMSSAYTNACIVAEEMENVYIIDSRVLSTGIALEAIYASKLVKENLTPEEIVKKVEKRIPHNQTSFILSRLDYLYKGGRCNSLSYLASRLLKIRPQIVVENGAMLAKKKYLGKYEKGLINYVNDTLEANNTPDLENVFITFTTCFDESVEEVRQILKKRGFKNIYATHAGATITSHCGENCLGILYLNDGDENGQYND